MKTLEWGQALWVLSRAHYRSKQDYVWALVRLYAYFGLKEQKDGVDLQMLENLRAEMRAVLDALPDWAKLRFDERAAERYYEEFWMRSIWRGVTARELLEFAVHLALRKVEGWRLPSWWVVGELFDRLRDVDRAAEAEAILWLEKVYGRKIADVGKGLEAFLGVGE